ncbi:hypothetical protein BOX15_Mlig009378g2 [Macrostomum lignano]|uniref:Tetraspanin n=2 Tax=Macrostomum lignano TaxID=282301 RepID=A0A1I8HVV8_9PLAT|nr:hypothetical protein BOX15_Mlig009378g1 [Macrostomum lignano]PAA87141.1 hypothetical protein BOX15_Mlig009378g2 [Macrostomum lignano]
MAFVFKWQFSCIFPLVINVFFIVSGITMMAYGIAEKIVSKEDDQVGRTQNSTTDGTLSMSIGIIDIIIGIIGLVTCLTGLRYMLFIYAGLLCGSLVGNLAFLVGYSISVSMDMQETKDSIMSDVRRNYGINSDPWMQAMSELLDKFQREGACCGWSGIDGKNIYLETPWYKSFNVNINGKKRTLPDSCCLVHSPDCNTADDIKAAREKGFVHKEDCMDKAINNYKFNMWMVISEVILSCIMQGLAFVFSVVQIVRPFDSA